MISFRISHPLSDCFIDPFWDPENTFSTFVLYLISSLPCPGANFIEKGGNQLKSMTFVLYRNFVVSLMRWNVIENRWNQSKSMTFVLFPRSQQGLWRFKTSIRKPLCHRYLVRSMKIYDIRPESENEMSISGPVCHRYPTKSINIYDIGTAYHFKMNINRRKKHLLRIHFTHFVLQAGESPQKCFFLQHIHKVVLPMQAGESPQKCFLPPMAVLW